MAQTRVSWFVVVISILLVHAEGFSSYTFKDYSLKIPSYVKMLTVGWLECVEACNKDFLCSSYTYQYHNPASHNQGLCELYDCGFDQCLTPGKTLVFSRGYVFQQIKPSHNRSSCIQDMDECASGPCQNGGSCLDTIDGFVCECPNGYSGNTCQVKHEGTCNPNPCFNGGTCHSTNDGLFWCDCLANHFGYTCESVRMESEKQ